MRSETDRSNLNTYSIDEINRGCFDLPPKAIYNQFICQKIAVDRRDIGGNIVRTANHRWNSSK